MGNAVGPYDFTKARKAIVAEVGKETMDFGSSPTWEHLGSEFNACNDVFLPELTHFIPMQDPVLVARYILEPDH